ncbi:response regulator transcription factor [Planococcus sp. APC 3900]|uniref:response regulator transcription factor n=1 Tax=Planococcus sp. APC 3900 TaxID=3035191 RepID=UPI0025B2BB12|nr:response regulator transcription factor [Planococcus sp. APC 3900]MDN3438366.1 response regulator transcription factor [Planococcus sp. APC 3900]
MGEMCKVLIVDDEMLIRQGIINYIDWEQEGFQIVGEASNGQEAMEMIGEFSPHIVVTDIVMPIMDGIDLVREAKKAYPHLEIIVLSSFENFDYVRSTFQNGVADYILKPKLNGAELLRILKQIVNRIPGLQEADSLEKPKRSPEVMLENMLLGYDSSADGTVFPNSRFVLVRIHGNNLDSAQLKAVFNRTPLEELAVYSFAASDSESMILLNFNPVQLEDIKRTIESHAAKTSLAIWMMFEPFDKIDDIKKVHDEGFAKMKKYLFYLPEQNVFVYDNLPEENEKQASFDLNHFIEMFKDRLFNTAFAYLENHVADLAGRYNNDSFEFKSFLGNIVFNIIVLLDAMKYDNKEIEQKKYGYFSAINDAEHVHEALAQFNAFLEEVRTNILSLNKTGEQENNIDKILAYIEQHYTEPLRLSEIASHFHFNASYLSSYFSAHHKEGFSEYLNRVRIKKSMDLLENSLVTISNISGMVGYSDHSYFCKVFKRITGTSPGSYRKEFRARHENEENGLSHLTK